VTLHLYKKREKGKEGRKEGGRERERERESLKLINNNYLLEKRTRIKRHKKIHNTMIFLHNKENFCFNKSKNCNARLFRNSIF